MSTGIVRTYLCASRMAFGARNPVKCMSISPEQLLKPRTAAAARAIGGWQEGPVRDPATSSGGPA
jgi:hypothetical protein